MKTNHFQLLWFQEKVVEYGCRHNYFVNAMDMGLGKSLSSLCIAVQTKSKTLIVCPSYLMLKWRKEIRKFFPEATVSIFENDKEIYYPWDSDFVIISYSLLEKAEILFEWADMVIADEAHYLKNMKAKRTEVFHRLVYENSIKRLSLLTGTPIKNRVYEFYSLLTLCQYNPKLEESAFLKRFPSYVDFANHFSHLKEFKINTKRGKRTVQQWEGYKNEQELKKWLDGIYIRYDSDLLDLPPFSDIDVPVDYKDNPELMEAFETFSANGENSSVQSPIKLKAALATAPFTVDYVKNLLDQGLQVVVYTDHPDVARFIGEKLGLTGITGATAVGHRQAQADAFQAGKQRGLVATIGSFATGIDLYEGCNMVFNDYSWIPGDMEQVRARIRRIGQKQRCLFHHIMGSHQSYYIRDRLMEKNKTIKAIIT